MKLLQATLSITLVLKSLASEKFILLQTMLPDSFETVYVMK